MRRLLAVPLLLAALAGCSDELPTGPEGSPGLIETCLSGNARSITSSAEDLNLEGGAYHFEGEVVVRSLRVGPGVVLCGAPGASIVVEQELIVDGTADASVLITAAGSEAWGVIYALEAVVRHAVVELGVIGLRTYRLDLQHVRFRQMLGTAFSGGGSVQDVVVDTVCTGRRLSCAAIRAEAYIPRNRPPPVRLSVAAVTVRESGGGGLSASPGCSVSLSDVRFEELGGTAISLSAGMEWYPPYYAGPATVSLDGGLSIRGQRGYLIEAEGAALADFLEHYGDSVRAGDRVRSTGSVPRAVLAPGVHWSADWRDVDGHSCASFGSIVMGPGSVMNAFCLRARSMVASGTPETPALLNGGGLLFGFPWNADSLSLSNVRVASVTLTGGPGSLLRDVDADGAVLKLGDDARAERVTVEAGGIEVTGDHGRLTDVRVSRSRQHGIVVRGDSTEIHGCQVRSNVGDGVLVEGAAGVIVAACDLEGNGGAGVAAEGAEPVLARGNWWGHPAGAVEGDGVRGPVDHADPLPGPRTPPPASISITADADHVATGDWLRLEVEARDGRGVRVLGEEFDLREGTGRLAFPDPADPVVRPRAGIEEGVREVLPLLHEGEAGVQRLHDLPDAAPLLAVGRRAGRAVVEAEIRGRPGVRGSVEIEVTEGAPYLSWEHLPDVAAILPFSADTYVGLRPDREKLVIYEGQHVTTMPVPEGLLRPFDGSVVLGGWSTRDLWLASWDEDRPGLYPDLGHWDGEGWTLMPREGISDVWAAGPAEAYGRGEEGVLSWDGSTWSDAGVACERTEGRNYAGEGRFAVSAGRGAYLTCQPMGGVRKVFHNDGSGWSRLPDPPDFSSTEAFAAGDGRVRLFAEPGAGPSTVVFQAGEWRRFPAVISSVVASAPYGNGAFVAEGRRPSRRLWYFEPPDRWYRIWYPGAEQPLYLRDVRVAGHALFLDAHHGLFRGLPEGR